jgi:hypothetical protein
MSCLESSNFWNLSLNKEDWCFMILNRVWAKLKTIQHYLFEKIALFLVPNPNLFTASIKFYFNFPAWFGYANLVLFYNFTIKVSLHLIWWYYWILTLQIRKHKHTHTPNIVIRFSIVIFTVAYAFIIPLRNPISQFFKWFLVHISN